MKRTFILFVTGMLFFSGYAMAATTEIGHYTAVEGRVDVLRAGSENPTRLKANAPVYEGDIVRTKSSSRAEMIFRDNSIVRLAPGSRLEIEEYDIGGDGTRQSARVRLYRGKARAIVSKAGKAENFKILTPAMKGIVKGTDIVAFHQADATGMFVADGSMSIENIDFPGEVKELRKGQCMNAIPGEHFGKGRRYNDAEMKMHLKDTGLMFKSVSEKSGKDMAKMKGMITSLAGSVDIIRSGKDRSVQAEVGQVVGEGDRIVTGEDGQAELTLENGNKIALKPVSELKIKDLRYDPKTGEYKNTFESKYGKIMAVVEKIGSKSTFNVKTPIATCGVRGTVMYLNIAGQQTQAFYEGGNGYMTSEITGITEDVPAGQNSTADISGNISVPVNTSDEQRLGLDDSWEAGDSVDDYSDPENANDPEAAGDEPVEGASDGASSADEVAEMVEDAIDQAEGQELLAEVPFDETIPEEDPKTEPEPESGSGTVAVSGKFGYADNGIQTDAGSYVDGVLNFSFTGNPWYGTSTADMAGTYSDNGTGYTLWIEDIAATNASDGGRFMGKTGGTIVNGKFRSTGMLFYIDPAGYGGVMHLDSTGVFSEGNFSSTGSSLIGRREPLGLAPSDLDSLVVDDGDFQNGKGKGSFDVTGSLALDVLSGDSMVLGAGRKWGIWFMDLKGSFAGNTSNNWTLAMSGEHAGGADTSPFFGSVNGTRWVDAGLEASYDGFFFDDNGNGKVNAGHIDHGRFIGTYDDVGYTWQALGGGEWVEITDILTEAGLGFTMNELETFITVPITESHYANMSGSGGGITSAQMDMRFYENALNNIWAGFIQGQHDGSMADNWSLNMAGSGNNVMLAGDKWSEGKWHASVAGTTSDGGNFTGEAAGTYCTENFEGVSGGTWTPGE